MSESFTLPFERVLTVNQEAEQQRLAHDKEEEETRAKEQKVKEIFNDVSKQWDQDQKDTTNNDKAVERQAAAEAVAHPAAPAPAPAPPQDEAAKAAV